VSIPEGDEQIDAGITENILFVSAGVPRDLQPYYVLHTLIHTKFFCGTKTLKEVEKLVIRHIKDDELKRRYLKGRMKFYQPYTNLYSHLRDEVKEVGQFLDNELDILIRNRRLRNS